MNMNQAGLSHYVLAVAETFIKSLLGLACAFKLQYNNFCLGFILKSAF